jgi:hypothetical protein
MEACGPLLKNTHAPIACSVNGAAQTDVGSALKVPVKKSCLSRNRLNSTKRSMRERTLKSKKFDRFTTEAA